MNVSHTRQGLKMIIQSYSRSKFQLSIRNNTHIQSISNCLKINSDLLMCVSNDTCNRTVALILIRLLNHKSCEQDWWIWHEIPAMWNWTYKNTKRSKIVSERANGHLSHIRVSIFPWKYHNPAKNNVHQTSNHFMLQHHHQD